MGKAPRILVMDAREDVASYLSKHLPDQEFDIQKISDLEDGMAAAHGHIPALILINGDDPAGIALATQFKDDPKLQDVPLVVLAEGHASEALVGHWFSDRPADFYVHRPLSGGFLDDHIRQMFAPTPAAAATAKKQPSPA